MEYFGIHIDINCLLCVGNVESAQYLFISCPYASSIRDVLVRQDLDVVFDSAISWADFVEVLLHILDILEREVVLFISRFLFIT